MSHCSGSARVRDESLCEWVESTLGVFHQWLHLQVPTNLPPTEEKARVPSQVVALNKQRGNARRSSIITLPQIRYRAPQRVQSDRQENEARLLLHQASAS